jgi:hypothetical protein
VTHAGQWKHLIFATNILESSFLFSFFLHVNYNHGMESDVVVLFGCHCWPLLLLLLL